MNKLLLLFLISTLISCGNDKKIITGEELFNSNCALCHGNKGIGITKDWRKADSLGNFPPPPLNGTAHTWHHSPDRLIKVINDGGSKVGGQMPSFEDKLSSKERRKIFEYIFSLWSKDIQDKYQKRFGKI